MRPGIGTCPRDFEGSLYMNNLFAVMLSGNHIIANVNADVLGMATGRVRPPKGRTLCHSLSSASFAL